MAIYTGVYVQVNYVVMHTCMHKSNLCKHAAYVLLVKAVAKYIHKYPCRQ